MQVPGYFQSLSCLSIPSPLNMAAQICLVSMENMIHSYAKLSFMALPCNRTLLVISTRPWAQVNLLFHSPVADNFFLLLLPQWQSNFAWYQGERCYGGLPTHPQ